MLDDHSPQIFMLVFEFERFPQSGRQHRAALTAAFGFHRARQGKFRG